MGQRDPELTDTALDGEIELLGALIALAAAADGTLSAEQVDAVLFGTAQAPPAV